MTKRIKNLLKQREWLYIFAFMLNASPYIFSETVLFSSETHTQARSVIDHGTHGALFNIAEEDMIQVLMQRLVRLKESGKFDTFQEKCQEKAQKAVLEPRAVTSITPTTHERVFYVDPTLVIEGDIRLPEGVSGAGTALAHKGDRLNPLHTLKLTKGLLFIDGDDEAHQQLALTLASSFDIVLVKGKPMELEEKLGLPIFFDQGGILTQRYGIAHVPAKMEMDKDRLKFTEFKL